MAYTKNEDNTWEDLCYTFNDDVIYCIICSKFLLTFPIQIFSVEKLYLQHH